MFIEPKFNKKELKFKLIKQIYSYKRAVPETQQRKKETKIQNKKINEKKKMYKIHIFCWCCFILFAKRQIGLS